MFIIKYWELIKYLTMREIKARYKQSFLGFFWIILNPFFQMLTMSFIFSKIMKVSNLGVPYPIFIYAGILPWSFFATSLSSGMGVLVENGALLKKIYFPREILVLATLIAKAYDLLLASIIFVVMMIFFNISFTPLIILVLPLFLIQFLFTFAIAILLSSLNLFYRDVQYLFNLILTIWFYFTPVLYAVELFPTQYRWIFKINPMSVFINAYRQILLSHDWPNWSSLGIGIGISLMLFIISYKIFKSLEGTFADVV